MSLVDVDSITLLLSFSIGRNLMFHSPFMHCHPKVSEPVVHCSENNFIKFVFLKLSK